MAREGARTPAAPPSRTRPHITSLPPRAHDAARDVAFETLYERFVHGGNGEQIEYRLAYPRHQFLSYLHEEKGLLFHGSNQREILNFEPRGQTLGPTQQQSELAVSACADGLWAMAFAILDRSRYRGSFPQRRDPAAVHTRRGAALPLLDRTGSSSTRIRRSSSMDPCMCWRRSPSCG